MKTKIKTDILLIMTLPALALFTFFMVVMMPSKAWINYCTDTPEGKAVISRMGDRIGEKYSIWDNEQTVQGTIQDIDRVRMWAEANTQGDEQKAWQCWTDYFMNVYTDRYKILHAQNTVKTPPK